MPIEFRKILETSRFLDPRDGFSEKAIPLQYRKDPLTRDMGLVRDFRFTLPGRPDLSSLIQKSLDRGCPFCPERIREATPKLPAEIWPEGRIFVGEATLFPNAAPYMPHSAVAAICCTHFVGLSDFSTRMLTDALTACRLYLEKVREHDPRARYCGIMWNYMPPANSSQIHPHLQAFAGRFPMVRHRELLDASRRYARKHGSVYWADLIRREKMLGERYIGSIGNTEWLTSFVPRSFLLDVTAIFQGRESIADLSEADLTDFSEGLTRVLRYMSDQNFFSFNMWIYSGTMGEGSFWSHARIIQRGPLPPVGISDAGNATLLGDTRVALRSPEFNCEELAPYFK